MSPLLFNLYTECLMSRVIDSGISCHVGDVNAAILMYADDIALLAPSRDAMQKLLNICEEFGREYHLSFNADKSEALFLVAVVHILTYNWMMSQFPIRIN